MRGIVKTYSSEKQYGFIKGDDGKEYFFHHSSFKNKNDIDKLCEGLYLHFEQKVTPKGYSAIQIELVEQNITIGYEIPDTIYTSKNSDIKGWEVIEVSNWIVHGSSRNSPDSAKEDMIHGARLMGANALFNMQYYKTTGSERGTGSGTYYTIHNFRGRAANISRKSPNGQYNLDDLRQINSNAKKTLKTSLVKKQLLQKLKECYFD